jgi:hypothetical protein
MSELRKRFINEIEALTEQPKLLYKYRLIFRHIQTVLIVPSVDSNVFLMSVFQSELI